MSSPPPPVQLSTAPRGGQIAVRVLLAVGSVLSIAIASVVVYRHYETADRDSSGTVIDAGRVALTDLRIGDCLDESFVFGKRDTHVRAVPCSAPHMSEVYAITAVSGQQYPGATEINNRARAACAVHQVPAAADGYFRWFVRPEPKNWEDGDRWVVCVLSAPAELIGTFSR